MTATHVTVPYNHLVIAIEVARLGVDALRVLLRHDAEHELFEEVHKLAKDQGESVDEVMANIDAIVALWEDALGLETPTNAADAWHASAARRDAALAAEGKGDEDA